MQLVSSNMFDVEFPELIMVPEMCSPSCSIPGTVHAYSMESAYRVNQYGDVI